jgi:hypothetical protein
MISMMMSVMMMLVMMMLVIMKGMSFMSDTIL